MQRNWIGRSEGAQLRFRVLDAAGAATDMDIEARRAPPPRSSALKSAARLLRGLHCVRLRRRPLRRPEQCCSLLEQRSSSCCIILALSSCCR